MAKTVYFDCTVHGHDRRVEREFELSDGLTEDELHDALDDYLNEYLDDFVKENDWDESNLFYSFGFIIDGKVVWSL